MLEDLQPQIVSPNRRAFSLVKSMGVTPYVFVSVKIPQLKLPILVGESTIRTEHLRATLESVELSFTKDQIKILLQKLAGDKRSLSVLPWVAFEGKASALLLERGVTLNSSEWVQTKDSLFVFQNNGGGTLDGKAPARLALGASVPSIAEILGVGDKENPPAVVSLDYANGIYSWTKVNKQ